MKIQIRVDDDELIGEIVIRAKDAPDTDDVLHAICDALRELADLEKCGACSVLWGPGNRERVGIGEYLCRECGGKPEEEKR